MKTAENIITMDKLIVFVHYINVGVKSPQRAIEFLKQYMHEINKTDNIDQDFTIRHYVMGVKDPQETKVECIYPLPINDDYLEQKTIDKLKLLEKNLPKKK